MRLELLLSIYPFYLLNLKSLAILFKFKKKALEKNDLFLMAAESLVFTLTSLVCAHIKVNFYCMNGGGLGI